MKLFKRLKFDSVADPLFWVTAAVSLAFVVYPFEAVPMFYRVLTGVLVVLFLSLFYAVVALARFCRSLEARIHQVERAFTGMREGFGQKFERKG